MKEMFVIFVVLIVCANGALDYNSCRSCGRVQRISRRIKRDAENAEAVQDTASSRDELEPDKGMQLNLKLRIKLNNTSHNLAAANMSQDEIFKITRTTLEPKDNNKSYDYSGIGQEDSQSFHTEEEKEDNDVTSKEPITEDDTEMSSVGILLQKDNGNRNLIPFDPDGSLEETRASYETTIVTPTTTTSDLNKNSIKGFDLRLIEETTSDPEEEDLVHQEVPWQAFLIHPDDSHFCPAVYINKKFLLSSQSCIKAFSEDYPHDEMRLYPMFPSSGARELLSDSQTIPKVEQIINHPSFKKLDNGEFLHDLSIIKANISSSWSIVPVCLPSVRSRKKSMEGKNFIQFRWSKNESNSSPQVEVNTVVSPNETECSGYFTTGVQRKTRLCAGPSMATRFSSCDDSYTGGSITAYNSKSGRHLVVGIFSYGQAECTTKSQRNRFAVFTRVPSYLKWIVRSIQEGECI